MYVCLSVCTYVGQFPWLVPKLDHTAEAVPVEGGGCSCLLTAGVSERDNPTPIGLFMRQL